MLKIKSKLKNFQFSIFNFHSILKLQILNLKFSIFFLLFLFFIYSRFVNIGWGLPHPLHPDERNMAAAVQQLHCEFSPAKGGIQFSNCFNPRFFAYGQFPLYLGYGMIEVYKGLLGRLGEPISFQEAVISLRIISAIASVLNLIIIIKIIKIIRKLNNSDYFFTLLILIFSPFFIQFAHFGTTESLLMLFYSLIIYYSLKILESKKRSLASLGMTTGVCGLAIATKVSSVIFLAVPMVVIFKRMTKTILGFFLLSAIVSVIFSPHNLLSFNEFASSIRYESDVASGKYLAFYTRQFTGTVPVLFQLEKIFPYALGWPAFILGMLGFFGLSWRDKKVNLLRLAFLIYFLPNAFLFAKWTRFMSPMLPIMLIFAILTLLRIKIIKVIKIIIIILAIIPGLAYLSIYQNPDVRLQASEWIYKNVPENSYILSETGNVIDLPLKNKSYNGYKNYNYISFNFYDLDKNTLLQEELQHHLSQADYIIVPSRRIFKNHSKDRYPLLNEYYQKLFSGELGFTKVAEFHSYPKLFMEFPDEDAEETWTVFDHPVIRIYKRVKT